MSPEKVTLKDIAERCGVTPTVVSAILNGRNSRITCCAEKRELILKTAREMNYRANFFARSIKMKQVPIIGLMLHLDKASSSEDTDSYVNSCLHRMTRAFNRHQLEVLFIPYSSEEEQLSRVQHLLASGLLGGVVTNIIPDSHQRICDFLASSRLPYMILGSPFSENVYCVYTQSLMRDRKILSLVQERGLSGAYQVLHIGNEVRFCRFPFPDNYLWRAEQLPLSAVKAEQNSALFITDIPALNLLRKDSFVPRNSIFCESIRFRTLLPHGSEAMLFNSAAEEKILAEYVETALTDWIFNDRAPVNFRQIFIDEDESWEYLPPL